MGADGKTVGGVEIEFTIDRSGGLVSEKAAEREVRLRSALRSADLHRTRAEKALRDGDRLGARAFAVAWVAWLEFAKHHVRREPRWKVRG